MSGPGDANTANKLIVIFFSAAAWFFALGILTYNISIENLLDLMIIGMIALVMSALHVFVPKRFKIHMNGIVTFVILMLLLISTPTWESFLGINVTIIQIFIIFFVGANMVYIVFYLGIYTACIDQGREEGISNDDYIKAFNIQAKPHDTQGHSPARGFLLKENKTTGDAVV